MSENRALILTYHAICEGPAPLCQTPSELEAQLDLLAEAGFSAQPLSALVDALQHGSSFAADGYAITFDDGYRDFAEAALPVLERRGIPATLFATACADRSSLPGGTGAPLLPLEELRELAERGVEIGAHSVGHTDLTKLTDDALQRELRECRETLERSCGRPVRHFAYPFGRFDERVRSAVAGEFCSACTTQLMRVSVGTDPLAIPRVDAYYLRSPLLRALLRRRRPDAYLHARRRLRQLRGSEPRARAARPRAAALVAGEANACR